MRPNHSANLTLSIRFMKTRIALLTILAMAVPIATSFADPANSGAKLKQVTDRDFQIASLLHRIYEHSVEAEEVEKRVDKKGGVRTPQDDLPVANLKLSIKKLGSLADVPLLQAKLSKNLEEVKKSALGPKHPTRRWLKLLSQSLERYGETNQ